MASPDGRVDLRSDTVTRPTAAMRRAMADAEVGDDGWGDDPTVNRLQELTAKTVGMPAALYVPSGTMANQIALRLLCRPGREVLVPARCHIRNHEAAAAAVNAGVQLRPLPDDDGVVSASDIADAIEASHHHLPPIAMLTLENTHMASGGRVATLDQMAAAIEVAQAHGLPVHCDAARLFNAAIALDTDAAAVIAGVTSAMFCLSKGLAAPVGSMLVGDASFIEAAREERGRLGGGMRQAGVIAAAAIVALETMVDRLADDHARAKQLAHAIATRFPGAVDPAAVPTNIVCFDDRAMPIDPVAAGEEAGILGGRIGPHTVRWVVHHDIDDADIRRVINWLDQIAMDHGA